MSETSTQGEQEVNKSGNVEHSPVQCAAALALDRGAALVTSDGPLLDLIFEEGVMSCQYQPVTAQIGLAVGCAARATTESRTLRSPDDG
jgi:hypothetical protein